jgi:hypothetical protein
LERRDAQGSENKKPFNLQKGNSVSALIIIMDHIKHQHLRGEDRVTFWFLLFLVLDSPYIL